MWEVCREMAEEIEALEWWQILWGTGVGIGLLVSIYWIYKGLNK